MIQKFNCWEFYQCGREPGGEKVERYGVCRAATEIYAHGLNGGINGGRICWAVASTCCKGNGNSFHVESDASCFSCEFHTQVKREEGLSNICRTIGLYLNFTDRLRRLQSLRQNR